METNRGSQMTVRTTPSGVLATNLDSAPRMTGLTNNDNPNGNPVVPREISNRTSMANSRRRTAGGHNEAQNSHHNKAHTNHRRHHRRIRDSHTSIPANNNLIHRDNHHTDSLRPEQHSRSLVA